MKIFMIEDNGSLKPEYGFFTNFRKANLKANMLSLKYVNCLTETCWEFCGEDDEYGYEYGYIHDYRDWFYSQLFCKYLRDTLNGKEVSDSRFEMIYSIWEENTVDDIRFNVSMEGCEDIFLCVNVEEMLCLPCFEDVTDFKTALEYAIRENDADDTFFSFADWAKMLLHRVKVVEIKKGVVD